LLAAPNMGALKEYGGLWSREKGRGIIGNELPGVAWTSLFLDALHDGAKCGGTEGMFCVPVEAQEGMELVRIELLHRAAARLQFLPLV